MRVDESGDAVAHFQSWCQVSRFQSKRGVSYELVLGGYLPRAKMSQATS